MNLRRLERKDLKQLIEIHNKYYNFAFPNINDPLYAIQRIVEKDDKIVLAGIVKLVSEVILITNKDLPPLTKMRGIKMMSDQLFKDVKNFGLDEFHVFSENDDNFINILHKLGFVDCTGVPLVRIL